MKKKNVAKKVLLVFWLIAVFLFIVYLFLPSLEFPDAPPNSRVSVEPADVETPLRRGYYTDLTREEVMDYYVSHARVAKLFGISIPTYRLNYPPEESQTLIRDQNRSNFLEEIVHPFRESLFISGFEPKLDKDVIVVEGKKWRQKLVVRHVKSSLASRAGVGFLVIVLTVVLLKRLLVTVVDLKNLITKK